MKKREEKVEEGIRRIYYVRDDGTKTKEQLYVVYRTPGRTSAKYEKVTENGIKAARRLLKLRHGEVVKGEIVIASDVTFKDLAEKWRASHRAKVRPHTLTRYEQIPLRVSSCAL